MSERTTGLNTTWEYSTELFKPGTVQRMMEHFRALGGQRGGEPRTGRSSQLSMLSEGERAKVLVAWNAHEHELPERGLVKDLFEDAGGAHRRRRPRSCSTPRRSPTRNSTGGPTGSPARLRAEGVGPGTLVGVLMEKSLDLVPAVLGVVKSGGAYIPLDPNYPQDRLEFMVADAQPKVLLTHARHAGLVSAAGATVRRARPPRGARRTPRRRTRPRASRAATISPTSSTRAARPASPRAR